MPAHSEEGFEFTYMYESNPDVLQKRLTLTPLPAGSNPKVHVIS